MCSVAPTASGSASTLGAVLDAALTAATPSGCATSARVRGTAVGVGDTIALRWGA